MNIAIIIGAVTALICLIVAFRFFHKKRLIDDLPTSKVLGVFIGLVELKGTAESESPLTSRLAGTSCVLYEWHVDEHWSRTVTETYRDAQGHMQTRTRHESGWKTVSRGSDSAPFYLKDDTGIIRIQPEGAKIEDKEVFDKTVTRTDTLYFGKGPANEIANTDHRRRFQETAIPLHTPLYMVGQARQREDIVAAEVANDKNNQLFITSTRTEKQVSTGYGIWLWVWAVLGLILAVAGVLIGNLTRPPLLRMNWEPYVIAVGGYIFIIAIAWTWTVFNSLVGLRQRVQQAWAQVDIQLKRRYDLIPNLIEAVEGYAAHEREVQELVTKLRQQMTATPPGVAGPDYSGFSPSLRVTVERYPDLKSSELFLKLQQSLTETEQRIALARDYFNNIASFCNARLEIVPDRLIGSLMKLRPQTLLGAADFERAPVQVKLAD
jgi:hypothetical protein